MRMPACRLKSSAAMWPVEPSPDEAYASSFDLARAMSSATVLAGTPGFTTSTCGMRETRLTATKSRTGS